MLKQENRRKKNESQKDQATNSSVKGGHTFSETRDGPLSDGIKNYVGTDVNSTLYEVLSTGKQSIAADIPKGDINSYMRSSVE